MMKRILLALFAFLALTQASFGASNPSDVPNIPTSSVLQELWPAVNTNLNTINLGGYTTDNDGQGGMWRWSANSTATADHNTIIPTGNISGVGAWTRSVNTLPCSGGFLLQNSYDSSAMVCNQLDNHGPNWGFSTFPADTYGAFTTIFATGMNPTIGTSTTGICATNNCQFDRTVAFCNLCFETSLSATHDVGIGSEAFRFALFPDRDMCAGALCMTWLGAPTAMLQTYNHSMFIRCSAPGGTCAGGVPPPYVYYPPGDPNWNYDTLETLDPGIGAKIAVAADAAVIADTADNLGLNRDACNLLHKGSEDNCVGYKAGGDLFNGSANTDDGAYACIHGAIIQFTTCIGERSGLDCVEGSNSTFLGYDTFSNGLAGTYSGANTCRNSVVVGALAASDTGWTQLTGNIIIGYNAGLGVAYSPDLLVIQDGENGGYAPTLLAHMDTQLAAMDMPTTYNSMANLTIGTSASGVASIESAANELALESNGATGISIFSGPANSGNIFWNSTAGNEARLFVTSSDGKMHFFTPASGGIGFGSLDASNPIAQTLSMQSVSAGATNSAGANFSLNLSRGTGTGVAGNFTIFGAPHGTTGSTQNAFSSALVINGDTLSVTANGQLIGGGTTTNNNAAAGVIGEIVESQILLGSAVPLTSGTAADVTSIPLTAGDWDVSGNVVYVPQTATSIASLTAYSTNTSATVPTSPNNGSFVRMSDQTLTGTTTGPALAIGTRRVSIATTTTVYLGTNTSFSGGTLSVYGDIRARRVR